MESTYNGSMATQKSSEFPVHVSSKSDAAKLRWLSSNEAVDLMTPSARKRWGKKLRGEKVVSKSKVEKQNAKAAMKAMRQVASYALWEAYGRGEAYPPIADHENCRMRLAADGGVLCPASGGVGWGFGEAGTLFPSNYLTDDGLTYDVVVDLDMEKRDAIGLNDWRLPSDLSHDGRRVYPNPNVPPSKIHEVDPFVATEDISQLKSEVRYFRRTGNLSLTGKYDAF